MSSIAEKSVALQRAPSASQSVQQGSVSAVVDDDPTVCAFYHDAVSESYRLKSELVAQHLGAIGMGRFHWILFVVTGFGWMVDNFWSQGISAARTAVANEFTDIEHLSFSSVAYYVGLILGASFWGTTADLIGRKPAFNATIMLGGIFACAVAGSPNFLTFCSLWAVIGTAAGGNVPVDSIIFLELVPQAYQWLLVSLSAWWNFGQLVVSLLAWVFLDNFACSSADAPCPRSTNMGWRYLMITLGGLAIVFGLVRLFVFKIPESPRYLISLGRDADAVESVNYIARYNGKPETLRLDMLQAIDIQVHGGRATVLDDKETATVTTATTTTPPPRPSYRHILRESLKDYHADNYKKLFSGRKMAQHTSVMFLLWLTIGIAYPLYFAFITSYLETKKSYTSDNSISYTYRVYCIVSAATVVGPLAAGYAVETRFGRRWMMAGSAILTGAFLFAYTSASTQAADIGFQCATGVLGNFEYAVMYAYAPESFPGPVRGTGTGIAATLLRLGGLVASLISTYAGYSIVPIYVSAALWMLAGLFCFGLPYETHGHASI